MSDDLRQKAIDLLVADIIARVKADDPKATLEIRALVAEKIGTHTLKLSNESQWLPHSPMIRGPYNAAPSVLDRTITSDPMPGMGPEIRCVGGVTLPKESA